MKHPKAHRPPSGERRHGAFLPRSPLLAGVPCDSGSQSSRTGEPVCVAGVGTEAARWERGWTGHEWGFRKLEASDPGARRL